MTIAESRIRGTELTIRSPRIWNRAQVHLAYSNQIAQAQGAFTGGLIPLVHRPRRGGAASITISATRSTWARTSLCRGRAYFGANIYYGSGFSNGSQGLPGSPNQDAYLPGHAQVDLSLGKEFGEGLSLSVTALNVANRHLLIDNSLTFGGFHYDNPREIYAEFRWRFHY